MHIKKFTFNPFQENSYVLYDETKECIIVDPGCVDTAEENILSSFIEKNMLKVVLLFNTHCHIDHILGNAFVAEKYNVSLASHKGEIGFLEAGERMGKMYGIPYKPSPPMTLFYEGGDTLKFGNTELDVLFTPGHSPASISLYTPGILIGGDVLFDNSIGRTDLPGGDHDTLIASIKEKLFVLPDETTVYCGHGPETTIGKEKKFNPFLQ